MFRLHTQAIPTRTFPPSSTVVWGYGTTEGAVIAQMPFHVLSNIGEWL